MTNSKANQTPEHMKRLNAAIALREIPDFQAALTQLQIAVDLAPNDQSVQLLTGLTYYDLEQLNEAERYLRRAHTLAPDSSEAAIALGRLLIENEQYQEAIDLLEPLKKAGAHNPTFAQVLADALINRDQGAEAVQILEDANKHWPENANVASQLGHLLLRTRQYGEAEAVLSPIAETQPIDGILINLAIAQLSQGNFEEALITVDKALSLYPKNDRILRIRTDCLLNMGRTDEALKTIENALSVNRDNPRIWAKLADTNFLLHEPEKGFEALEEGLKLVREPVEDLRGLKALILKRVIYVLRYRGVDAVLKQTEVDLEEVPSHTELRYLRVKFLIATGRYEKALEEYHAAIDNNVAKRRFVWELFEIYHGIGDPVTAWTVIPPAPEAPEDQEEFYEHLEAVALNLYQNDDVQAARRIFEKVVELDPTRTRSLNNLSFILIGEGETEKAATYLDQVVRDFENSSKIQGLTPETPLANLGYVFLLQREFEKAIKLFKRAEELSEEDESSILRVAYWCNGDFQLLPQDQNPKKFRDALLIIRANLAIAHYLSGKTSDGISKALELIDQAPTESVGYRILGCFYLDQGEVEKARQIWQEALEIDLPRWESEIFEQWLEDNQVT